VSPELGFAGWTGAGRLLRAALAAPVGTGHRAASAGARLAWAHKGTARTAARGARGGGRRLKSAGGWPGRELTAAARGERRRRLGWAGRSSVRRGRGPGLFLRRRASSLATSGPVGEASERVRAGRRRRDRRSMACTYGGSVFAAFPGFEVSRDA
jgi:hypothetical protein